MLAPAALFAAVPVMVMPPDLRSRLVADLAPALRAAPFAKGGNEVPAFTKGGTGRIFTYCTRSVRTFCRSI